MLTAEQRAELKALADAATPGPWWSGVCNPADGHALAWIGSAFVECNGGRINYAAPSRDAEFIAAAREAIPALLADLEEVEAANKDLINMASGMASTADCLREELVATRKLVAARQLMEMKLHGAVLKMRDNTEAFGPNSSEAVRVALHEVLVAMDEHEYGNTTALSAVIAEAVEPWIDRLLGAANYIDRLGGNSMEFRVSVAKGSADHG